jgi:hypothetical protein
MGLSPTDDVKNSFPSQWWDSQDHPTLRGLIREDASHILVHAGDIRQ